MILEKTSLRVSIRRRTVRPRENSHAGASRRAGHHASFLGRHSMARQKISPCLWFDGKAEEAARFYVSVFPDSEILGVTPGPTGAALVVRFRLAGIEFLALNGGPQFTFNEAISLSIDCRFQAEVDELWEKLSAGGSEGRCGWLKDRYGLSWQVVPAALSKLLADPDRARSARVMEALMRMTRLDIRALEAAADGTSSEGQSGEPKQGGES
jgi:predicted 3-demethylubiquinone-9 3-methyltransferase (glyoxalase superfamily)